MSSIASYLGTQDGIWSVAVAITVIVSTLGFVGLKRLLYPTYDPREPKVLRPRIPLIGHIISLVRECGEFYIKL